MKKEKQTNKQQQQQKHYREIIYGMDFSFHLSSCTALSIPNFALHYITLQYNTANHTTF